MLFLRKIFQDTRAFGFLFLTSYTIYALRTPGFSRNFFEIALAMLTCILLDYILLRFYKKVNMFPVSGMISSFGLFLIADSPKLWVYPLLAVFAITSKHFLTRDGKHIFNPNNIALVLGILLFDHYVMIVDGTWGGQAGIALIIILFGSLLVYKANRGTLVISFLSAFIIFALTRSWLLKAPALEMLLPLTGPAFFLFTFYMITDPKTTPRSNEGQIAFGVLLALIDAIFRYNQSKYAPFLSLFIMTGFYPLISEALECKLQKIILPFES